MKSVCVFERVYPESRWRAMLLSVVASLALGIAIPPLAPTASASGGMGITEMSGALAVAQVTPATGTAPASSSEIRAATTVLPDLDFVMPSSRNYRHITTLYTGLTRANLEVCGCAQKQLGGIAPRAAVIEETRKNEQGRVLVVDAGRFMTPGEELERKRCEVYLEAMSSMGYDAVALSRGDFVHGYEFLKEQAAKVSFPFLSCNMKFDDDGEVFWRPWIIKDMGDTKIGVIGFSDPGSAIAVGDRRLVVSDPIEALAGYIAEVSAQVDAIVIIGSVTENVALAQRDLWKIAEAVKGADIVIGAAQGMPKRDYGEGRNKTIALTVVEDGKSLGRMDMNIFGDGAKYVKVDQVELPKGMEREPKIRGMLDEFYTSTMKDPDYASKVKDVYAGLAEEADPENAYVGHAACESCHKPQYHQWKTTVHSKAFFTLLNDDKKRGDRKHYYVPECLSCHTTGYGVATGFGDSSDESLMRDVQCEVCHGPGKKHVEAQKAAPTKQFIRRTVDTAFCERCHDQANSPKYKGDVEGFWRIIRH